MKITVASKTVASPGDGKNLLAEFLAASDKDWIKKFRGMVTSHEEEVSPGKFEGYYNHNDYLYLNLSKTPKSFTASLVLDLDSHQEDLMVRTWSVVGANAAEAAQKLYDKCNRDVREYARGLKNAAKTLAPFA